MELLFAPFVAFFALPAMWMAAIGLTVFLLLGGVVDDRRGKTAMKWWALLLLVGVVAVMHRDSITLDSLMATATDLRMWTKIGIYLGIGFLYSFLIEFILGVRKSALYAKEKWAEAVKQAPNLVPLVTDGGQSLNQQDKEDAANVLSHFYLSFRPYAKYIELGRGKFGLPDPRVNKAELACHVGAWMVFWPLYAVSLLLGDVIARVFDIITMMMGNFTNVVTKTLFKDVFKV